MNEREALERIAKYPMSRSEEMSIETAREIARAALASQAQQPAKPFIYISEDEFAWRSKSGDLNGTRSLTCITPQHFGETHYRNFTVPLYLQPQAQQTESKILSFDDNGQLVDKSQAQQPTKLVFDSESARQFLLENVLPKFSDSTFQKYVREELAGDFAYQLVMYLQSQAQQPTEISKQLREYAADSGYSHNDYADTMLAAASEIERLIAPQAQQPCTTCGGAVSLHSPDGEYRGECPFCSHAKQEPAAYLVEPTHLAHPMMKTDVVLYRPAAKNDFIVTPLYALPPAPEGGEK